MLIVNTPDDLQGDGNNNGIDNEDADQEEMIRVAARPRNTFRKDKQNI
jgi:hypothetical protein